MAPTPAVHFVLLALAALWRYSVEEGVSVPYFGGDDVLFDITWQSQHEADAVRYSKM